MRAASPLPVQLRPSPAFRSWRAAAGLALAALLAVASAGCATGDDGIDRRGSDGAVRLDSGPVERIDSGPSGGCSPDCTADEVCRGGVCIPASLDGDADGVPATVDCDDADAGVGSSAERACTSTCGAGIERCTDGVWAACTAPESCDCVEGTSPRALDCEMCGTRRQVCVGGSWVDDGGCMGMGPCTPGAVETGAACGCGGTEQRTCTTGCTWGAFVCTGGGGGGTECTAGQMDTQTASCGRCGSGTMTRTRTCNASTCRWNAFVDGACSGESGCNPGETRAGCDPCGQEVCSSSCTWGACQPATGNACLRIRPGTSGPAGNNWECCGSGRWHFCLSSCQWSSACDTCSGCGC